MMPIRGEPVIILRPHDGGVDEYNEPVKTWTRESVDNVLVSPNQAGAGDIAMSNEPNAIAVTGILYFPRSWRGGPLRGCKVIVRGETYRVVGDPIPLWGGIAPTPWGMSVPVSREDGQ